MLKTIQAIPYKTGRNILFITLIAFTIFAGGTFMLHVVPAAVKDKIADGLLADFVITVPALYYFIIVRPLKISPRTILLILSICCVIAYLVLPQQQRGYLLQIRKLTALAELLFIIYAVTKFTRIRKLYKTQQLNFADPIYNLRAAMSTVFDDGLAIKVLAAELAMLRYGLLFWKKEKSSLKGSTSFSTHKEFGYVAIWCILLLAVTVEITAFHLLLMKWSNTAANIVTALSLYGAIFLVADLSAMVKRKVLLNGGQLILRTGLRWRIITSTDNVASIKKITGDYLDEGYFKGGVIKNSGNILITFKQPVQVDKLYGAGNQFGAVVMNIDNFEAFADAVNPVTA
jgi:hypothetical protein